MSEKETVVDNVLYTKESEESRQRTKAELDANIQDPPAEKALAVLKQGKDE